MFQPWKVLWENLRCHYNMSSFLNNSEKPVNIMNYLVETAPTPAKSWWMFWDWWHTRCVWTIWPLTQRIRLLDRWKDIGRERCKGGRRGLERWSDRRDRLAHPSVLFSRVNNTLVWPVNAFNDTQKHMAMCSTSIKHILVFTKSDCNWIFNVTLAFL